ncbi:MULTISPECIES: hypothetical protein [unclassified Kosakonia]|uniref:hypothetical protein n=1 Tax=unclassified Kosakonia TaxID=2632876 RepID=UPI0031B69B55
MRTENQALSSARILMLAIICCIVVANIYFNQSVLNPIAATFPHEWAAVSLIPMATQLGYAAGLFLLIPLGDYIERQRLILRQAQVLFLALIGMMLAPTATVLVCFSFLTGMAATVALPNKSCRLLPLCRKCLRGEKR